MIPATLVWNYPTITQLAAQLAIRIGVPLDAEAGPQEDDADLAALVAEVEALSVEQARGLLTE